MGANGALHLAFRYPEVFSVAAGVSGGYILNDYPEWEKARSTTVALPKDLRETSFLIWYQKVIYAFAAAVSPNPENAPFYFDLPFEIVNGEAQIVPEVLQKVSDANVINDAQTYLNQPGRLRGIAITHGVSDPVPIEMAESFSATLTALNIAHDFFEVAGGHCGPSWDYSDLLVYISNHLAHEQ